MRAGTLAARWVLAVAALLLAAQPAAATSDRWVWPLSGPHTVSRPFDPPATPYGRGHRGADLPGRPGQLVLAAGAGRIAYAGLLAGRGVLVVVHGDLRTTYEPVTAVVAVGQWVAAGQVIGRLDSGHPGCPGTCLHWGLLRGDVYLDPVRLVSRGRSRLLPVGQGAAAVVSAASPVASPAAAAGSGLAGPSPAGPSPAGRPTFALRAGDAASAGGALAALVAGLLLLRRPPRPPHRPVSPALAAGGIPAEPGPATLDVQAVGLVDLASERHRRRPEVA